MRQLDIDLFRQLNGAGSNSLLDAIMVAFTIAGTIYVIVLLAIPLWLKGKREASIDLLALLALVTIVTEIVKVAVDRQRPNLELTGVHTILSASGPSFPSAHAARAFAVAVLVAAKTRRTWAPAAYAVASLVALSRVYLGVHWPSDVIAGALFGIVLALFFQYVATTSHRYRRSRGRMIECLLKAMRGLHRTSRSDSDSAVSA